MMNLDTLLDELELSYNKNQTMFISALFLINGVISHNDEFTDQMKPQTRFSVLSSRHKIYNKAFRKADVYYHLKDITNLYNYLVSNSKDLIDELLFEIRDYVSLNIHKNVEVIEEEFIQNAYGNMLVLSNNPKSSIYLENTSVSSLSFNLFNDDYNIITEYYCSLKNIPYTLIDINNFKIPSNEYFDTALFYPHYANQYIMQRMELGLNKEQQSNVSFEWTMVEIILSHLKENGTFISCLPLGNLNKVTDLNTRRNIYKQGYFKTIIELPRLHLLSIPLAIVVFGKDNPSKTITIVDATKYAQNLRRSFNIDSTKVIGALHGELDGSLGVVDKEYLDLNGYDLTPHRFINAIKTEFVNPTPLRELTSIIYRGFQIPSDMLDEYATKEKTHIKLLTLSDIEDGAINQSTLQPLKALDKKMEHYVLENNDLVISCKGKSFKTAVVKIPYGETYVSTGSLITIRCLSDKLDPTFLKIFLDSNIGTHALERIQTGQTVLSLNPSKLLDVQVPLPPYAKQLQIASGYKYKMKDIEDMKKYVKNMKEETDKKFNINFMQLLN